MPPSSTGSSDWTARPAPPPPASAAPCGSSRQPISTGIQKQTVNVNTTMQQTSTSLALREFLVGLPSLNRARRLDITNFTILQNNAPVRPVVSPRTVKVPSSHNSKLASLSGNSIKPDVVSLVNPLFVNFASTAATMVPRKACHVKRLLQNEEASSRLKRMPPTGAPKAAATPMAAPWEMNSQRLRWPARTAGHHELPQHPGPSEKPEATMPPRCANGPSVPAKSPDEVTSVRPTDLEAHVRSVKACGMAMPLRNALISGIPLPPACGATYVTRMAAKRHAGNPYASSIKKAYQRPAPPVPHSPAIISTFQWAMKYVPKMIVPACNAMKMAMPTVAAHFMGETQPRYFARLAVPASESPASLLASSSNVREAEGDQLLCEPVDPEELELRPRRRCSRTTDPRSFSYARETIFVLRRLRSLARTMSTTVP
mmetsp:Transcript_112900/g.319388  ORF Transcript_112900/g.319388 Transcript_112900/m.319388 type:complete len:429 (+) Transcript_112900:1555-2841(+)